MALNTEMLFLGPFKEVIERGKEAVVNAEYGIACGKQDSAPLLNAAQAVAREGERALNKLQPLWNSQMEKYGSAFEDKLSQNEDIEDKRRELEVLLYDFEDYIEVTTFDPCRFTELQAATKAHALSILNLIKKLKLDPPKPHAFPPLPPLPPLPSIARNHFHRPPTPSGRTTRPRVHELSASPPMLPALPARSSASRKSSSSNAATREQQHSSMHHSLANSADLLPQPAYGASRTLAPDLDVADGCSSPEALVPAGSEEVRSEPHAYSYSVFPLRRQADREIGTTASISDQAAASPRAMNSRPPSMSRCYTGKPPLQTQQSVNIPQEKTVDLVVRPRTRHSSVIDFSPLTPILLQLGHFQIDSSPSISDGANSPGSLSPLSPLDETPPPKRLLSSSDSFISGPFPREPDLTIGPRSSLYQLGHPCAGAHAFRACLSHQDGIRRVAGHVAGISTPIARCVSCSYGHAFAELALDITQRSPRASFARAHGVLFRIRFLYKSHLKGTRPGEAFYACLFCEKAGYVPREGDATVFRNADALFRHLARHSERPLVEVPGLTVLYGKQVSATDPRVHDFDLWFTNEAPPLEAGGPDRELLLARLPVATAVKSHVQRYAEKKLSRPKELEQTNAPLLQFFIGARIIGVEFPRALAGTWCTGWHDDEWGYFPAKSIELDKPPPGRADAPPLPLWGMESAVQVSVVARWRWEGSSAGGLDWLGFEKGERINGVGWPLLVPGGVTGASGKEAWCWSGTNSKGRFGVFPRSHVDEGTLMEEEAGFIGGAEGGGGGRRKKVGGRSLFGLGRGSSSTSNRHASVDELI